MGGTVSQQQLTFLQWLETETPAIHERVAAETAQAADPAALEAMVCPARAEDRRNGRSRPVQGVQALELPEMCRSWLSRPIPGPGWLLPLLLSVDPYAIIAEPERSGQHLRLYAARQLLAGQAGSVPRRSWAQFFDQIDLLPDGAAEVDLAFLLEMEDWLVKVGTYGEAGYGSHGLAPLAAFVAQELPPPNPPRDWGGAAFAKAAMELEALEDGGGGEDGEEEDGIPEEQLSLLAGEGPAGEPSREKPKKNRSRRTSREARFLGKQQAWEREVHARMVGVLRVIKRWQWWLRHLEQGEYPTPRSGDPAQDAFARVPQLHFGQGATSYGFDQGHHPDYRHKTAKAELRPMWERACGRLWHVSRRSAAPEEAIARYILHALGQETWDLGEEAYRAIEQHFDLAGYLAFPADYAGETLANRQAGRHAAFFPTPMNVVELMTAMTVTNSVHESYPAIGPAPRFVRYGAEGRSEAFCDPCGGMARLHLVASNYGFVEQYYQDIWPTAMTIARAHAACWVPWMILPMRAASELMAKENGDEGDNGHE
jgi:hypothetical protein